MVMVVVRVLHYPNPEELVTIARKLGSDYDERVLPSIVNEVRSRAASWGVGSHVCAYV